jgi:hypothetical protein
MNVSALNVSNSVDIATKDLKAVYSETKSTVKTLLWSNLRLYSGMFLERWRKITQESIRHGGQRDLSQSGCFAYVKVQSIVSTKAIISFV